MRGMVEGSGEKTWEDANFNINTNRSEGRNR